MGIINFEPSSSWQSSFTFEHIKCLIVCRGPIRLETIKIFQELNIRCGILLSEKDSIIFPNSLAPELLYFSNRRNNIHHIFDYGGETKEGRELCIDKIIKICFKHGYTHVFAGYGFMAEDYNFVSRLEGANLSFIGPNSKLIWQAGSKDEAKKLARSMKVSVIPGEDCISALTLLEKAGNNPIRYFRKQIKKYQFKLPKNWESLERINQANTILQASYLKKVDLFSISDLQDKSIEVVKTLLEENPGKRIRFKHVLGGGGKGQRIVSSVEEVPDAVMSVLVESKTSGVGDNKNFLIELNIENSRHVEIQLVGNGEWCTELGGRDCSLQMHDQKLIEFSLTEKMLKSTIKEYESLGKKSKANVLKKDLKILKSMCLEAEKFGEALKLNSVSTFECIVDSEKHYFMEVNTRIQVEHRVTEMAYKLLFTNPDDPSDHFYVNSLIAAMILINCYGKELPRPKRVTNSISGIEARINSTNASLNPHSGGILSQWSNPSKEEIRDDQGIGIINPYTGFSQPYKLSGAYDSNIALSVTSGNSRKESFEKLAEILRQMNVRGQDLNLNIDFIYGMLNWFLGNEPMLKPNTNFVYYYLALTGKIKVLIEKLNLEFAWEIILINVKNKYGEQGLKICEKKITLIKRPLEKLLSSAHLLMGWIGTQKIRYEKNKFIFSENPIKILQDLYYYLDLEYHPKKLPSDKIWIHDQKLLDKASYFYENLIKKLGEKYLSWTELNSILNSKKPPNSSKIKINNKSWETIIAAHKGHQIAMELLGLPMIIAGESGYYNLKGNNFLEIEIPDTLLNFESNKELISRLTPSFSSNNNEILATTGGTFYSRETPDADDFVKEGQFVEKGQVLGLLEVMKMFNEIRATYPGTVRKKSVGNGSGILVSKGQPLFLIEPQKKFTLPNKEQIFINQKKHTSIFMEKILPTNLVFL